MDEVPATNGSLIIKTSLGDLEIELWSKEAPRACRNFIQLGLESFYDDSIIHRIVPGFCIQGGLITATTTSKEHLPVENFFGPELHSRLKFNKRGLLGMVDVSPLSPSLENNKNEGKKEANNNNNKIVPVYNSQFFISLDQMPEMDRKHTLFGRVVGDTIFNLLRIGECEVDSHNKPIYPPKIIGFEILKNPFEDVIPRTFISLSFSQGNEGKASLSSSLKAKSTIPRKMLSFDVGKLKSTGKKIKSTHETIKNDPTLSTEEAIKKKIEMKDNDHSDNKMTREKDFFNPDRNDGIIDGNGTIEHGNGYGQERDNHSIIKREKEKEKEKRHENKEKESQYELVQKEIKKLQNELLGIKEQGELTDKNELPKESVIMMTGSSNVNQSMTLKSSSKTESKSKSKLSSLIVSYKEKSEMAKTDKSVNEINTLLTLNAFHSKLQSSNLFGVPVESLPEPAPKPIVKLCRLHGLADCRSCTTNYNVFGGGGGGDNLMGNEGDDEGWMMHKLVFDKEAGYTQIKHELSNLKVIDPRQREKEFNIVNTFRTGKE